MRNMVLALLFAFLSIGELKAGSDPTTAAEGRFESGLVHIRSGQVDLAVEDFREAIRLDGKNAYFHKALGVAYLQQKKYKEAIDTLKKALEINPYYADVRNDLGTALLLSGRREEGKKTFQEAFDDATTPSPEISARNLGQAYFEEKNYAEAMRWYQRSLEKNDHYGDAYLGLSDCLLAMGHGDEALVQLEAAAKKIPDDVALLETLGESYYKAGRFSEARGTFEKVAQKDPAGANGRRALDFLKRLPKSQ